MPGKSILTDGTVNKTTSCIGSMGTWVVRWTTPFFPPRPTPQPPPLGTTSAPTSSRWRERGVITRVAGDIAFLHRMASVVHNLLFLWGGRHPRLFPLSFLFYISGYLFPIFYFFFYLFFFFNFQVLNAIPCYRSSVTQAGALHHGRLCRGDARWNNRSQRALTQMDNHHFLFFLFFFCFLTRFTIRRTLFSFAGCIYVSRQRLFSCVSSIGSFESGYTERGNSWRLN